MFTLIKYLKNRYTRRATPADIGKMVLVSWDGSLRAGCIDWISSDGGFSIHFGNAVMVVPAMIYGYRTNPFKNIVEL
jgi:hypothetical protein